MSVTKEVTGEIADQELAEHEISEALYFLLQERANIKSRYPLELHLKINSADFNLRNIYSIILEKYQRDVKKFRDMQ